MTSILAKINPIWSKNQCLTPSIYSPLQPHFTNTINTAHELISPDDTTKAAFTNTNVFGVGPNNTTGTFIPNFTVDQDGDTTVHDLTVTGTASINGVATTSDLTRVENKVDENTTNITELQSKVTTNTTDINDINTTITNLDNKYLPLNPQEIIFNYDHTSSYQKEFSIKESSLAYTNYILQEIAINSTMNPNSPSIIAFRNKIYKTNPSSNVKYTSVYGDLNINRAANIKFGYINDNTTFDSFNSILRGLITSINKNSIPTDADNDTLVPSLKYCNDIYALKDNIPTVKVPLIYTTSKSYDEINPANPESSMTINSDIVSPIMLRTNGMDGNLITCDLTTPFQQIKDYATTNNLNIKYMTIHLAGECAFRRSDATIVGPKNDNFRLYCYLNDVIEAPSDNKTANCVIPVEYCPGYFNGKWEKYFYKSPISCTIYNSNSNILTRSNYYILFGFTNYDGTTNIINYLNMSFTAYLTGYFEEK